MPSYSISYANGRVASGENDAIILPRTIRGSSNYGVVLFHGANSPNCWTGEYTWPDAARLAAALARAGIPCIVPSDGVDGWANDTAMSRITSAMSVLASNAGCSATKVHLIGISMGGGTVLRYAALNPANVASVNAIIPMASILNLYRNNAAGGPADNVFTSSIAPAWGLTSRTATTTTTINSPTITSSTAAFVAGDVGGPVMGTGMPSNAYIQTVNSSTSATLSVNATASGSPTLTYWQPLPTSGSPNADILGLAPAIKNASIPGRLFYSTVDPYILTTDVTAVANAAGLSAIAIDSTYGHTNGSMAEWRTYNSGTEFSDLVTYLETYGA